MDIRPLSDTWFANIFSHVIGWLFVFLMVLFETKKGFCFDEVQLIYFFLLLLVFLMLCITLAIDYYKIFVAGDFAFRILTFLFFFVYRASQCLILSFCMWIAIVLHHLFKRPLFPPLNCLDTLVTSQLIVHWFTFILSTLFH